MNRTRTTGRGAAPCPHPTLQMPQQAPPVHRSEPPAGGPGADGSGVEASNFFSDIVAKMPRGIVPPPIVPFL
ncbi:hypothetical protein [Streptomyces sp. NPDC004267]|uniref:hypothetical protein n=1 Tax=Streptomyces sp. NPDC004267 TaxID=3364694 RepID=UPI00369CCEED